MRFRGTKREAEKELARLVADAADGRTHGTQATFGFLLEKWWEQKRGRLSVSTAAEYRRIIDRQVGRALGKVKLSKLTVAQLDDLYLGLERSGLAPSTVRQVHAVVSGALKQAVKWRWIGYNPARDASLPAARRSRIQPLDPAKVRALMAKAEEHSPEMGLAARISEKIRGILTRTLTRTLPGHLSGTLPGAQGCAGPARPWTGPGPTTGTTWD